MQTNLSVHLYSAVLLWFIKNLNDEAIKFNYSLKEEMRAAFCPCKRFSSLDLTGTNIF